ncbi:hypothetical protein EW026_g4938 [Hermanssonia centrifuga]|uniref:Peptidase M24 domain-containing protein n=1 Tax=Hermanssonia centrifuga TaxID=98765 RepID=A0A4S4KK56_9APHY|nr:hypothetical protein EW026_g4938 [Hermanssonia centrifuga]
MYSLFRPLLLSGLRPGLAARGHAPLRLNRPRPLHASPIQRSSNHDPGEVSVDEEEPIRLEDEGEYEIILPLDEFSTAKAIRTVPTRIQRPPYALAENVRRFKETGEFEQGYRWSEYDGRIMVGTVEERKLRRAADLARRVLRYAGGLVQEGVTTDAIDAAIHKFIVSNNAYPSPLLYKGYPKSCCTSVNNILVHGIPDDRPLRNTDIINIDVTVYLDGFHGDTSKTFLVGDVDRIGRDLVQTTEEALEAGIRGKDFVVCPAFTGHGIGAVFHSPPWIFHDVNEEPGVMMPGDCFTIEPCIVKGSNPDYFVFPDDWTASSANWARSAQAEHMILITYDGADVLTRDDSHLGS